MQCFFFFKQKTAYEMRISDWSSDVCSSDLRDRAVVDRGTVGDRDRLFADHMRVGVEDDVPHHVRPIALIGDRVRFVREGIVVRMRGIGAGERAVERSEEHTSALQSLMRISYAVFCLKKKIRKTINIEA